MTSLLAAVQRPQFCAPACPCCAVQLKESLAEQIVLGLKALAERGRLLVNAVEEIRQFVELRLDCLEDQELPSLCLDFHPE